MCSLKEHLHLLSYFTVPTLLYLQAIWLSFFIFNSLFVLHQMYDGVKPTLGELEKFEATPDEVEVEGTINRALLPFINLFCLVLFPDLFAIINHFCLVVSCYKICI